jgi:hypothetical protein
MEVLTDNSVCNLSHRRIRIITKTICYEVHLGTDIIALDKGIETLIAFKLLKKDS